MTKPVTLAAVEAMKAGASSEELDRHYWAIEARIADCDNEIQVAQLQVDDAPATGDPDAVKAARQRLADLREESTLLCRVRADVHQAVKNARGAEAIAAEAEHRRELAKALTKAEKAHAMLAEVRQTVAELTRARNQARDVGGDLNFDRDTIRALSELCHPPGDSLSKQMMIDLGIRHSTRNLAA